MFGIGLPEVAVILVVAVLVFGPDKLPDLAKQAAQLIRQFKTLSDGARDELRSQLGPEYADLELRDLHPRALVHKHVLSGLEAEWRGDGADSAAPRARNGRFAEDDDELTAPVDLIKSTHWAARNDPDSEVEGLGPNPLATGRPAPTTELGAAS